MNEAKAAVSEDAFLGGRVRIRQPARGYRAGADAILLAAAVAAPAGARLLEAGCGAGAVLLSVAALAPEARLVGVERDPLMAALARENVIANFMQGRVEVREADVLNLDDGGFDGVFVNPPFDQPGDGAAPHPARRHAYLTEAPLEVWVKALCNKMAGGAALTLIQRAHRLPEILAALEGRLGSVEVLPIRPAADKPAKRILVRARKGGRAGFRLYAGLDLHDSSGAKFTPEAEAIFRGEARVRWG